jgi:hypothetical protein
LADVSDAAFHVVFFAVFAAASPLVLTATFLVIRSERPRTNGIAFLLGFVFGTVLACAVGLILGEAAVEHLDSHDTVEALVTLVLGLGLVGVGLTGRGAPPPAPDVEPGSSRVATILASLRHVRPAAACSMAGLLGFGGPKRLVLTLLAMAWVNSAGHGYVGNLTLVVVYIVVATVLVWVPVGIVIVAGERAAVILGRGESWMTSHARVLRTWLCLGLGVALVVDSLVRLL